MTNISGWMIYPVDDITGFYCIIVRREGRQQGRADWKNGGQPHLEAVKGSQQAREPRTIGAVTKHFSRISRIRRQTASAPSHLVCSRQREIVSEIV